MSKHETVKIERDGKVFWLNMPGVSPKEEAPSKTAHHPFGSVEYAIEGLERVRKLLKPYDPDSYYAEFSETGTVSEFEGVNTEDHRRKLWLERVERMGFRRTCNLMRAVGFSMGECMWVLLRKRPRLVDYDPYDHVGKHFMAPGAQR